MFKIAFVTPWYGPDIPGGAEAEARQTAEHLAAAGLDVEVVTTCIADFHADWSRNAHPAGVEMINGVRVRRFPVEKRNKGAFDQINQKIISRQSLSEAEEEIFREEFIKAPQLTAWLRQNRDQYLYFFIPYLFPTTFWGIMAAPERSIVIPCLHDEGYAYLDLLRAILPKARGIVFHSQAEADLFERIYGAPHKGQIRTVLGEGLQTDATGDPERFRSNYRVSGRFALYAGRRTTGKNIHRLFEDWRFFKRKAAYDIKLVLIGPGKLEVSVPREIKPDVVDLGFVPQQSKWDGMAAADLLINPSLNESFSLVLFESWVVKTPALVNGRCAVTTEHVRRANGGLYYSSRDEFSACMRWYQQNRVDAGRMGINGHRYVVENYNWQTITDRYIKLIKKIEAEG